MTPEEFLAALYTDETLREQFLDDPRDAALAAGFSEAEAEELASIDPESLALAARSFGRKREAKERLARERSFFRRVLSLGHRRHR